MTSFGPVAEGPVASAGSGYLQRGTASVDITSEVFDFGSALVNITSDIVYDILPIAQDITSEIFDLAPVNVDITQEIPHYWASIPLFSFENVIFSTAEAISRDIISRIYDKGTVGASIESTITVTTYSLSLNISSDIFAAEIVSAGITSTIYGASDGTQEDTAGTLIPAGLMSYGQATPVLGTPTAQTNYWTAKVILKGLDVSVNLTGVIMVDKEENAAAIAEFTLKPTVGLVDLTQWVRADVLVYYIPTDVLGNTLSEHLLFRGFVDVPTYSPQTRLTTFTCTDELQKAFESQTTPQIDTLVGGFWSKHVFSEDTDKWSYAQDRLSTIPYTMDYDINRALVKTPWAAKVTPDFTLNEAVVIDGSVSVSLANSRSIINTVEIESTYQYDSFKELAMRYSWTMYPSVKNGMANYAIKTVTFTHVLEAVQSAGWTFSKEPTFQAWPPTGWYAGVIVSNVDEEQIVEAHFTASKRYRQYVNDAVAVKMYSPKSVASLGELKSVESFSLSAEYTEDADGFDETEELAGSYEANLKTLFADEILDGSPVNPSYAGVIEVPFKYQAYKDTSYPEVASEGADVIFDLSETLIDNTRLDFENVLDILQNLYKNNILGSHRNNSVAATMLIEPNINREHTVRIDTYAVKAKGKVRQVTHSMNIEDGSATTVIAISVSRSTGLGIPDVETPLDKTTTEPGVIVPSDVESYGLSSGTNYLRTWVEAKDGGVPIYDGMRAYYGNTDFVVSFPAIETEAVEEVTANSTKEFIVDVPDEELILNA